MNRVFVIILFFALGLSSLSTEKRMPPLSNEQKELLQEALALVMQAKSLPQEQRESLQEALEQENWPFIYRTLEIKDDDIEAMHRLLNLPKRLISPFDDPGFRQAFKNRVNTSLELSVAEDFDFDLDASYTNLTFAESNVLFVSWVFPLVGSVIGGILSLLEGGVAVLEGMIVVATFVTSAGVPIVSGVSGFIDCDDFDAQGCSATFPFAPFLPRYHQRVELHYKGEVMDAPSSFWRNGIRSNRRRAIVTGNNSTAEDSCILYYVTEWISDDTVSVDYEIDNCFHQFFTENVPGGMRISGPNGAKPLDKAMGQEYVNAKGYFEYQFD